MNVKRVYVVDNGDYPKSTIRKYPYLNVSSGKSSFQNCYVMKAYMSLEEAKQNLEADSDNFYRRYGKCNWYIDEAYGHRATIDNPYYDDTEKRYKEIMDYLNGK